MPNHGSGAATDNPDLSALQLHHQPVDKAVPRLAAQIAKRIRNDARLAHLHVASRVRVTMYPQLGLEFANRNDSMEASFCCCLQASLIQYPQQLKLVTHESHRPHRAP